MISSIQEKDIKDILLQAVRILRLQKTLIDAYEAVMKHSAFRTLLNTCFMDAIDKFCFTSTEEPPERKVLDALLEFVIVKKLDGEKSGTKELSPFNEHGIDFSPVVRSFLLQLCLQCDEKLTQEHVETFMLHKKEVLENEDEFLEFSQLYSNCVQDMTLQRILRDHKDADGVLTLQSQKILNDNLGFKYNENQVLDVSFLDTISSIRLALEHVATCISRQIEDPQMVNESFDLKQFLRVTSEFLKQSNEPVREFVIQ